MTSKRCRLYDENLVHNIMLSTGLSVLEYLRENANANSDEICDFVESNAEIIVNDTISHFKGIQNKTTSDGMESDTSINDNEENSGESTDDWPKKND